MNKIIVHSKPVKHTFAWLTIAAMVAISFVGIGVHDASAQVPAPVCTLTGSVEVAALYRDLDLDSAGNYYYANDGGTETTLFKADASGNVTASTSVASSNVVRDLKVHDATGDIYFTAFKAVPGVLYRCDEDENVLACTAYPSGSGLGKTGRYPTGIGIDAAGYVYVADRLDLVVDVFNDDGTGSTSWSISQVPNPSELAVDTSVSPNRLYIIDSNSNEVHVYDTNQVYYGTVDFSQTTFGNLDDTNAELAQTYSIEFDENGDMYLLAEYEYLPTGEVIHVVHVIGSDFVEKEAVAFADGVDVKDSNIQDIAVHNGSFYADDWVNFNFDRYTCDFTEPPPDISVCTLDALENAGIEASDVDADFLAALDVACLTDDVISVAVDDVIKGGLVPLAGEVYVIGNGATIKGGIKGGGSGTLILGDDVTVKGGVHAKAVQFTGIESAVSGGVTAGTFILSANADLSVSGGIDGVTELFEVGANSVLTVNGEITCSGAAVNQDGTAVLVVSGTISCGALVAYAWPEGGGSMNLATILPLFALAALGLAIYVRPKKS